MCDWLCYVVRSEQRTYVGITNNLQRRLRQHNGEIKGGAKATRGRRWTLLCTVQGFPSVTACKQFEWRMHHPPSKGSGLAWRLRCLEAVLALPRWTKTAPPSDQLALALRWHQPAPRDLTLPCWVSLQPWEATPASLLPSSSSSSSAPASTLLPLSLDL